MVVLKGYGYINFMVLYFFMTKFKPVWLTKEAHIGLNVHKFTYGHRTLSDAIKDLVDNYKTKQNDES
jgi:hypothetical protein